VLGFENPVIAVITPLLALTALIAARLGSRIYRRAYSVQHPLTDFIAKRDLFKKPLLPEILAIMLIAAVALAASNPYIEYSVVEEKVVESMGTLTIEVKPPVVLILDNSGSMAGEKIARAKEALIAFIERVAGRLDVGLIVFDHEVNRAIPPTSSAEELIRVVESVEAGGGTMYSYPLMLAYQWLKPYRDLNVSVYVVFASDGVPADLNEAERVLKMYREVGIPIYGIFIGYPWEGYDVIKHMSEETGGEAYVVEEVDKLVEKYVEVASTILNKTDVSVKVKMVEKIEKTVRESLSSYLLYTAIALALALYAVRFRYYRVSC